MEGARAPATLPVLKLEVGRHRTRKEEATTDQTMKNAVAVVTVEVAVVGLAS